MKTIKGNVTGLNDITGSIEPIQYANVFLSNAQGKPILLENGSATGTTTIDQGYFEIMNVPETGFITASFIGYKPITLSYRNTTRNINFELPLEVNQISEVEILGTKPLEKKPNLYLILVISAFLLALLIYIVYRLSSKSKKLV